MCGFTGLLLSEPRRIDKSCLDKTIRLMTKTLILRGPDALGYYINNSVALGHSRLSILDLTDAGSQPMELHPHGPVIAYNGECYNFRELRSALEILGHQFRGHSDTEVILHTYNEWGLNGLKRLEGIFALALWDPLSQRLVLMRDRLGVKPLYFGESEHGLAFGSEIKAVLAAGGVDTSLDDQAFSEFLWYGNCHEDRSFYRGIRSLSPGHWLIIEKGKRTIGQWWKIEEWLHSPNRSSNMTEASEQVRLALDMAVSRQLVADVPVGIFLSGGIDSSAIAAAAMHVQQQPLTSYAAGFDFLHGVNELPKARQVADKLGLNHHELKVSEGDLPQVLMALAQAHDEPFADPANIPLYLMSRELSGQIKVVLQGDGGDELFAGYRRHAMLRNTNYWQLFPQLLIPWIRKSSNLGHRFARMAETLGNADAAIRMALLLTVETLHAPPETFFRDDLQRHLADTTDPFLAYRNAAVRFQQQDPVQQMLLTDLTVQLPSQFLTKVDRATMAAGIEARVPFLDERVAELVVGMPSHWKAKGTEKKIVLRESQRGRVPNMILDGHKTGFSVPYQHWLRTTLYEFTHEHLLEHSFLDTYSLNRTSVEQALKDHRSKTKEHGFMLWKLLQLALWKKYTKPKTHSLA